MLSLGVEFKTHIRFLFVYVVCCVHMRFHASKSLNSFPTINYFLCVLSIKSNMHFTLHFILL